MRWDAHPRDLQQSISRSLLETEHRELITEFDRFEKPLFDKTR